LVSRLFFLVPHHHAVATVAQAALTLNLGADGVFLMPGTPGKVRALPELAALLQPQHRDRIVGVRQTGPLVLSNRAASSEASLSALWLPRGEPEDFSTPSATQMWVNLTFTPGHTGRARVRAQAMARAGWVPVIDGQKEGAWSCATALQALPLFSGIDRPRLAWLTRADHAVLPPCPEGVTDVVIAPPPEGWNPPWCQALIAQVHADLFSPKVHVDPVLGEAPLTQ
jgi:hypothetical protein